MATTYNAERRVTFRYVEDYCHLDQIEPQDFTIKMVSGKVQFGDRSDCGYTQWLYLTASRPVTTEEMAASLFVHDKGCACEHDCCGHYTGGAQDHRLRPKGKLHNGMARRWKVPVGYSPNY